MADLVSVEVTGDDLTAELSDGRRISVPLSWYPRLLHGTLEERSNWRLVGKGDGIHWPDLDEDISARNIILGQPSGESPSSLDRWLKSRPARCVESLSQDCEGDRGRRVLFLGAGASVKAGYPLASELIERLKAHFDPSTSNEPPNLWEEFLEFRQKAKVRGGVLGTLLNSDNPEIVITAIDLLLAERAWREHEWWRRLADSATGKSSQSGQVERHPYETEPPEFKEARLAREGLRGALAAFFSSMNADDVFHKEARLYLREELAYLRAGDVVVTTNYDTLVERTLFELNLWNPSDGYGFVAPLKVKSSLNSAGDVSEFGPAPVKVFKLHGSVGWHMTRSDKDVYLRSAGFLQFFPLNTGRRALPVEDSREQDRIGVMPGDPVAIAPSFLKVLDIPVIGHLWREVDSILRTASEMTVIGYSLPESDSAIRVLLNSIRHRIDRQELRLTVRDSSPQTLSRWRVLMGEKVRLVEERFGDTSSGTSETR